MIQAVTRERWDRAQVAEALTVDYANPEIFRRSYMNIFNYLGMDFDQQGNRIIEVGCGGVPAVSFCQNVNGIVIEPIITPALGQIVDEHALFWIKSALEDMGRLPEGDECWLFNVMQHVRDPEEFVWRCKKMAPVIRYFEPVDYPTCEYHPHTFSQEDFLRWFGEAKRYTPTGWKGSLLRTVVMGRGDARNSRLYVSGRMAGG